MVKVTKVRLYCTKDRIDSTQSVNAPPYEQVCTLIQQACFETTHRSFLFILLTDLSFSADLIHNILAPSTLTCVYFPNNDWTFSNKNDWKYDFQ